MFTSFEYATIEGFDSNGKIYRKRFFANGIYHKPPQLTTRNKFKVSKLVSLCYKVFSALL
ncbi:hypothetical protein DOY81_001534 [Sarcophaga bullata]|nr:hypothetical protein DOY81_001534 [Sarcophaga bullata]